MATGSGKTVTALVLASKVAERNRPLVLVVVCPFINLCRQWIREIAAFGVDAVPCFEGRQRWQAQLEEGYQRLAAGLDQVLAIVTTNATFQSDAFQCRLRPRVAAGNLHHLLIADEVHNLGADNARNALPDGIALRLGLSATPERHFDPAGTAAVLDYFGPIVYQYTLSQAIADGRLCRYRYHPILVDLTDAEADEYLEITTRLARFYHGDTGNDGTEPGGAAPAHAPRPAHRGRRKQAQGPGSGDRHPTGATDQGHLLLRRRRTTDAISQDEIQQIKAVARFLGETHGLRVRNFTFRETPQERVDEISHRFSNPLASSGIADPAICMVFQVRE